MIGDGCSAGGRDALVPGVVLLHLRRPGDVVHGPGAAEPALGRRLVVGVDARRASRRVPPTCRRRRTRTRASPRAARGSAPGSRRTRARRRSPAAHARPGTSGCSATSGASSTVETTSRWRRPSGSSNVTLVVVAGRACRLRREPLSQKSSAASEATRHCTVCTIPAPARPRRTPGYSKNVMSLPGRPPRPRRRGGRRSGRPG